MKNSAALLALLAASQTLPERQSVSLPYGTTIRKKNRVSAAKRRKRKQKRKQQQLSRKINRS